MIHTGDISHAAKANEFDDAQQLIGRAKLDVHYAPGEHDILDPKTRDAYLERFGKGATGGGWYSFDQGGVHFVSLNNVVDLKKNGLGSLGAEQLEWLEDDLKGKSASTPIVIFSHIPLWMIAPEWGWGTEDSAQALALSLALRLGDRAQRPHPSIDAEGGRQRHVPHRALDRLSATRARNRASARTEARARGRIAQMARRSRGRLFAHAHQSRRHRFGPCREAAPMSLLRLPEPLSRDARRETASSRRALRGRGTSCTPPVRETRAEGPDERSADAVSPQTREIRRRGDRSQAQSRRRLRGPYGLAG